MESFGTAGNDNVVGDRPELIVSNLALTGRPVQSSPHVVPLGISQGDDGNLSELIAQALREAQIDLRARKPLGSFIPVYLQEKAGKVASKIREEIGTKIRIFTTAIGDLEVHGRQRAGGSGRARPAGLWQLTFLSGGAISLEGQAVRLIDPPADAGRNQGIYEERRRSKNLRTT